MIFRKKKNDVWSMMERFDKKNKEIRMIADRPGIKAILERYGKGQGDIKEIHSSLLMSGTGGKLADFVIRTPEALTTYLTWKKGGISDLEINSRLRDRYRKYRFTD